MNTSVIFNFPKLACYELMLPSKGNRKEIIIIISKNRCVPLLKYNWRQKESTFVHCCAENEKFSFPLMFVLNLRLRGGTFYWTTKPIGLTTMSQGQIICKNPSLLCKTSQIKLAKSFCETHDFLTGQLHTLVGPT